MSLYATDFGEVRVNPLEAWILSKGSRGAYRQWPERQAEYEWLHAACERVAKFKDGIRD